MTNPRDKTPFVDILLSTYNGSAYLEDLLKSIKAQTYKNWRLMIRDDGSTDDTVEIIKAFSFANIVFIKDTKQRLGSCQSFSELTKHSIADYVMFCDQDDVWLPNKIELSLKTMRELEAKHKSTPILVHTDLKVVDNRLNPLAESFWKYQHINPSRIALNNLLIMNVATGCTMMINRQLKELSAPIPQTAIIHDWWITLVAASFGKIEYINSPTILYRQHGENDIGAIKYSLRYFMTRLGKLNETTTLIAKIIHQASTFYEIYKDKLNKADKVITCNFATLFERGRLSRLYTLLKFKYFGYGFARNLGIIMLCFLIKDRKSLTKK